MHTLAASSKLDQSSSREREDGHIPSCMTQLIRCALRQGNFQLTTCQQPEKAGLYIPFYSQTLWVVRSTARQKRQARTLISHLLRRCSGG